ncbi:Rz-like spanin [Pseudomonas phage phCDa]|uniref:Uncharacterized protein n=1 Tax=Pseudomonas phage phCDa TaxID=2268587 RepID=A0A2Z5H8N6_9CAUD|nr:Rz-like spanin [Pseudomonas phage phCDa]AXC36531.1 hypothetical protein phCDa_87 [Pseudomonas phage phCDa]
MKWKVLGAAALLLFLLVWVYNQGELKGELKVATLTAELATARAEAKNAQINQQQLLDTQAKELTDVHLEEMGNLQRAADHDRASSDSLRGELAKLQTRLRNQPVDASGAGFQLSSATKAAMVLSDMFSSCSAERSELAGAFDESHARGLALEKRYDKARGQ